MLGSLVRSGLGAWWAPAVAAGVVSFASPCVLPLVPGYLSFVSGAGGRKDGGANPMLPILLFVGGFATVFTLLGAFAGALLPVSCGPRSGCGSPVWWSWASAW